MSADKEIDARTMEALNFYSKWREDSSLESWFPFTAKELTALRLKVANLEVVNAKLRQIVSEHVAALNSGFCSPDASLEFMDQTPNETRLVIQSLTQDRDRFKKLAEESKWVSVFERLPDEEGHYLVHGLNKRTWETYYDPSDCKPTWRNNFTHWMPLPQPPSTQP